MDRPTARRLTDEQRELASRPEHLRTTAAIAEKFCRRHRMCDREEIHASAMVGLCDAAARFDPTRGAKFETYLPTRVKGSILDAMRIAHGRGLGCGRGMLKRDDHVSVVSTATRLPTRSVEDSSTIEDNLASPELPIGWEIEAEDTVRQMSRSLTPKGSAMVVVHFLDASCGGLLCLAGEEVGVKASRSSSLFRQSCLEMRNERATCSPDSL